MKEVSKAFLQWKKRYDEVWDPIAEAMMKQIEDVVRKKFAEMIADLRVGNCGHMSGFVHPSERYYIFVDLKQNILYLKDLNEERGKEIEFGTIDTRSLVKFGDAFEVWLIQRGAKRFFSGCEGKICIDMFSAMPISNILRDWHNECVKKCDEVVRETYAKIEQWLIDYFVGKHQELETWQDSRKVDSTNSIGYIEWRYLGMRVLNCNNNVVANAVDLDINRELVGIYSDELAEVMLQNGWEHHPKEPRNPEALIFRNFGDAE